MIRVLEIIPHSEIPTPKSQDVVPKSKMPSTYTTHRKGLHRIIREILDDLPPQGLFVKVSHDYPTCGRVSARFHMLAAQDGRPLNFRVLVRGNYAFIGRKTK